MKCLVIRQPWAWLIATKQKTIEVRSWKTLYRGPLAIASSKKIDTVAYKWLAARSVKLPGMTDFIFGAVIAKVTLRECVAYTPSLEWQGLCPSSPGLYGFMLEDVITLDRPVKIQGRLGLFEVAL